VPDAMLRTDLAPLACGSSNFSIELRLIQLCAWAFSLNNEFRTQDTGHKAAIVWHLEAELLYRVETILRVQVRGHS
jgi:hypothetical protein